MGSVKEKNLDEKTTLVDADRLRMLNSADSNDSEWITYANLKTQLNNDGIGGGGGSTEHDPFWVAGDFAYPASNPAPLNTRTLTNGTIKEQLHDDTTDESLIGHFKVPSDIDTSGTVTFRVHCSPSTAAASKNIAYDFQHSVAGDTEDIDVAYTVEASGDKALSATQDALNVITWTETVSNLGWAASDICRFILNRHNSGVTDNLSGDLATWYFEITIPRS